MSMQRGPHTSMDRQTHSPARRLVVGNWKSRKSLDEACAWFDEFRRGYQPVDGVTVALAPPLVLLYPLAAYLTRIGFQQIALAAQDVSPFPPGSYTGETAADLVRGVCRYAIIGHPERHRYFHESGGDAVNKVSEAADAGIIPIICVDEQSGMSRLTALRGIDTDSLVIAYIPADAHRYHRPQDPEKTARAVSYLSQVYPHRPIICGGGIDASNCHAFTAVAGNSGLMVGDGSLKPQSFLKIVQIIQQQAAPA